MIETGTAFAGDAMSQRIAQGVLAESEYQRGRWDGAQVLPSAIGDDALIRPGSVVSFSVVVSASTSR